MIISDSELRRLVGEELAFEPSVDATHIGVTAHDGVVTLSGHVASHAQKVAAERAVSRVRGVRAIAETVEVHLPSDKKRTDEEIAERDVRRLSGVIGVTNLVTVTPAAVNSASVRRLIESALKRQAELEARSLMVNVDGSRVTITGNIESMHERNIAVQAAWSTPGVTAVNDRMTVA